VWEHDERTWTLKDLREMMNLGRNAVKLRTENALEEGTLIEGHVRGEHGHFVKAYRLAE